MTRPEMPACRLPHTAVRFVCVRAERMAVGFSRRRYRAKSGKYRIAEGDLRARTIGKRNDGNPLRSAAQAEARPSQWERFRSSMMRTLSGT